MSPSNPLASPVESVSLAVDEDVVDNLIHSLGNPREISPRAYLEMLALAEPTGAQVNFESGPSLEIDATRKGLILLARFMEKIAPLWSPLWIADCLLLRPSEAP